MKYIRRKLRVVSRVCVSSAACIMTSVVNIMYSNFDFRAKTSDFVFQICKHPYNNEQKLG